ncbi:MAG TPA: hypothetical protein VF927_02720, partial [Solirubrobacteraceae bacterium]
MGLCAAIPILASTLRALIDGWLPAGDQANIATRSYDVLTSHTPLVGQHSDATELIHHAVYGLGPMLYWLLAIPARLPYTGALILTIGLVNCAAVVGVTVLARRRGGLVLMYMAALGIVLVSRSLAPEVLHDIWNPSAALFPFTFLIFLCWSVACGEHRLLILAVLTASFVVQCQFAFLAPSLGLLVIAIAGLLAGRLLPRARSGRRAPDRAPGFRRWALAAALVAVICWAPPAIDQIRARPGNLTAVAQTVNANRSTFGPRVGWHAVVLTVGLPPWWLTNPASPWQKKVEVREAPSVLAEVSAVLALVGILAVGSFGLVRRRAELWSGALIALCLCASVAAIAAATPTGRLFAGTLGYTMWLASPAGMFAWLVLLWMPTQIIVGRLGQLGRLGRLLVGTRLAAAVALSGVAAGGTAVALAERPDEHLAEYRPLGTIFSAIDRTVPAGRTILLPGGLGHETFRFKMAARYALVRNSDRPLSPGSDARLPSWYWLGRNRYDCTLYVRDGRASPHRGA